MSSSYTPDCVLRQWLRRHRETGDDRYLMKAVGNFHDMIYREAHRLCRVEHSLLEDMVAVGMAACVESLRLYQEGKGTKVSTWVADYLPRRMMREYVDTHRTIRVPAGLHSHISKVGRVKSDLIAGGMDPTPEAVASRLAPDSSGPWTAARVSKVLRAFDSTRVATQSSCPNPERPPSLDRPVLVNFTEHLPGPAEDVHREYLRTLPDRDRRLLQLYVETDLKNAAVGQYVGLTRERVRQLAKLHLRNMRPMVEQAMAEAA